MSPQRYVVHLRLHRAIELVRDGRSGLAEIAARTGFADQSHLSCWVRRAVTSGLAGKRPHAGWALGARICSAMEGLIITRALAVELAPIRGNIVCPGVVKSPLWAAMTEPDRAALYRQTAGKLPVEIAEAYLYLMRQTYGTGQVVVVDGGAALV